MSHIPTTEDVRKHYAFTKAGDRIHRTEQFFAEFDQWLANHDAEVLEAAASWFEGSQWNGTRRDAATDLASAITPPDDIWPAMGEDPELDDLTEVRAALDEPIDLAGVA